MAEVRLFVPKLMNLALFVLFVQTGATLALSLPEPKPLSRSGSRVVVGDNVVVMQQSASVGGSCGEGDRTAHHDTTPLASQDPFFQIRDFRMEDEHDRTALFSLIRELQEHELSVYDRMKPPDELVQQDYLKHLQQSCQKWKGNILLAELLQDRDVATKDDDDDDDRDSNARNTTPVANNKWIVVGYAVVLTKVQMDHSMDEIEYEYGEIAELAVTEAMRGKGVGSLLMRECVELCKRRGIHYLRTEVLAANSPARKAYTKFGFEEHMIVMEKKL
ncbi:MAG: hypothetical protein SGILL_003645 [Bacillariaceae sp.]